MIDTRAALASAPDLRHRIAAERAGFEQLLRRAGSTDSPSAQLDALLRARPPAALRSVGDSGDAWLAAPSRDRQPGGDVDPEELRLQWRELARRVESAEEDPATLICLGAQLADTERRLRAGAWAEGGSGVGRAASGLDDLVDAVGMPLLVLARIGPDVVGFHHDFGGVTTAVLGRWASLTTDLAHLERALARVASGGEPAAYEKSRVLAGELDDLLGPLVAPSNDSLLVLLDRGLDARALTALPRLWPRAVCFASLAMTAPTTNRPKACLPGVLVAVGPRLLHAESESASVATTWNAAAPVATCAAVRAGVPGAGIIHLAAHASLRWTTRCSRSSTSTTARWR